MNKLFLQYWLVSLYRFTVYVLIILVYGLIAMVYVFGLFAWTFPTIIIGVIGFMLILSYQDAQERIEKECNREDSGYPMYTNQAGEWVPYPEGVNLLTKEEQDELESSLRQRS
jgi:hypothetical protein